MTNLLNGLLGGLAVGVIATLVARLLGPDDPSASVLWVALDRGSNPSRWLPVLAGVSYGGIAGASLLALELLALNLLAVPPELGEALAVTLGWSGFLLALWLLVLWAMDRSGVTRSHLVTLVVYHLVYGPALGLWIRVTWIT